MPVTTNTRKLAALLGASGAGIGTDGLMQPAGIDADMASQAELDESDNRLTTNLAVLAIRQAADHNDVKYSLQDRIIDDYYDASGIDGTPSNAHVLASGTYSGTTTPTVTHNAQATGTSGNYTWYKYTTPGTVQYQTDTAQDYDYVVVAGGGGGGSMGAGGAGGFRTATGLAVAASTNIAVTVGAGGGGVNGRGSNGGDSAFSSITSAGGGGGGGFSNSVQVGSDGGSGGGGGSIASSPYTLGAGGAGNTPSTSPAQGFAGGPGFTGANAGGGGGGATAVGGTPTSGVGGAGGAGENNIMGMNDADSDTLMTAASAGHDVGGLRYLAGGGGGTGSGTHGNGGSGGGGNGKGSAGNNQAPGTDGTGGGGGAGYVDAGGDGGNGIVLIRHLTAIIGDMILQSTDTEAETQPTKADMVMLIEDAGSGVATLGTHIKGFISRDSGTTFTEGTLVDEGDWGTDKRILAFHDLDISGQPADKTMCYKITTHSSSAVYDTRIHATSIGWK